MKNISATKGTRRIEILRMVERSTLRVCGSWTALMPTVTPLAVGSKARGGPGDEEVNRIVGQPVNRLTNIVCVTPYERCGLPFPTGRLDGPRYAVGPVS